MKIPIHEFSSSRGETPLAPPRIKSGVAWIVPLLGLLCCVVNEEPLSAAPPSVTAVAVRSSYDGNGNLTQRTDGNGVVTNFGYDDVNRLVSIDYPGGGSPDVSFAYDANGNRTGMSDATGITSYRYDLFDRLTGIEYPDGGFVTYGYDNVGNVTDLRYGNHAQSGATHIRYTYDPDNRISTVTNVATNGVTSYTYDAAGLISRRTLPNGVYSNYEYDGDGRLIGLKHRRTDTSLIVAFDYILNAIGNRTQMRETTAAGAVRVTSFNYDSVDRLRTVNYPSGRLVEYDYDSLGRRTKVSEIIAGAVTEKEYLYDSDSRLLSITKDGAVAETLRYDGGGSLVQRIRSADDSTVNYLYDFENRLVREFDGARSIEYTYNGMGERTGKVVNGVKTAYVNDPSRQDIQVLAETNAAGDVLRAYEWGNELIDQADATGAGRHYFLHDAINGSVRRVIGHDTDVLNTYEYDSFGSVLAAQETAPITHLYRGEDRQESGLIFLRSRYYDPGTGKFLTRDPKGVAAGIDHYTYAKADPVNLIDPGGTASRSETRVFVSEYVRGIHETALGFLEGLPGWSPETSKFWYAYKARNLNESTSYYQGLATYTFSGGLTESAIGKGIGDLVFRGLVKVAILDARLALGGRDMLGDFGRINTSLKQYKQLGKFKDVSDLYGQYFANKDIITGSMSIGHGKPGGVALNKSASVLRDINSITGGAYDQATGQILLYGKQDGSTTALPKMSIDDLAVAFRAIAQGTMPVVSIEEPEVTSPPEWPGRKCYTVRYGPFFTDPVDGQNKVLDVSSKTYFGWVMFEADRLMKSLALGRDNRYPDRVVRSNLPGFKTFVQRYAEANPVEPDVISLFATRFWFEPDEIVLIPSTDGASMEISKASMRVSTEAMFTSGGEVESTPEGEDFAKWFTDNYDALANEQVITDNEGAPRQILKDLKQLAYVAGIVKWVEQNKIPLDLAFLRAYVPAFYDGAPTHTPATQVEDAGVPIGSRPTYVLEGGVTYCADLQSLPGTASGRGAMAQAARPDENTLAWQFEQGSSQYNVAALSIDRKEKDGGLTYSATDASFQVNGSIPLVLGRSFDSFNIPATMFGFGWKAQPYALEPKGNPTGFNLCHQTWQGYGEIWFSDQINQAHYKLVPAGIYDRVSDPLHLASRFAPNLDILVYRYETKEKPGLLFTDGKTRDTMRLDNGVLLDFDLAGNLTRIEDRNGNQVIYSYDAKRRLASIGQTGGRSIVLSYDAADRVTGATLPDNRSVSYSYNERSDLTSVRIGGPTGRVVKYAYDADHRLKEVQDEGGAAAQAHTFDVYGRITETTQPGVGAKFQENYDLAQGISWSTGPESFSHSLEFNSRHDPIKITDARGKASELVYNDFRDVMREKDADGVFRQHYYDARGNQIATVQPNGRADRAFFDVNGNPTVTFHSPSDGAFQRAFDGNHLLTGNAFSYFGVGYTQYAYDARGNLTSVTDGNGNPRTWDYDARGNASASRDGRGKQTDFTFDGLSRLTRVRNELGHQIDLTYDSRDAVTRIATSAGAVDYSYDEKERLASVTTGDPGARRTTSYTYDAREQIRTVTDPSGVVTEYSYDGRGNLVEVRHDGLVRFTYEYDGLNRVTAARYAGTAGGVGPAVIPLTPAGARAVGGSIPITWLLQGDWTGNPSLKIQFSTNGSIWTDIATVTAADGQYLWNPGNLLGDSVQIRFIRPGDNTFAQVSTPPFAIKETGSLRVTLSPPAAVSAGAMWRVDRGAWLASGAQVAGVTVGTHAIEFKAVPGWDPVPSQIASIVANQPSQHSAAYSQLGALLTLSQTGEGTIRVNGQPIAAPYSAAFIRGQTITLQATPQVFWTGGLAGTSSPAQIVMDSDKTIVANFDTVPSISSLVWTDLDGDGVQDGDEPGISEAIVELYASTDLVAGNGDDILQERQATDNDGHYRFEGVSAGKYYLAVQRRAGFKFTKLDQGADDQIDSDVDPATGRSTVFAISTGQSDYSRGAGLVATARYYVNDSSQTNDVYCTGVGSDTNDGLSRATPKASLQSILDTYDLGPADLVLVDAGNYTLASDIVLGSNDSGDVNDPVTIRGVLGRTVFNRSGGGGASFQISGINYLTIENFEIRGGSYGVSQPNYGYNNIVLRHNVFTGQTSAGVNVYRGGITLEGNTFYQTNAHGYYGGSTNSTLKHNIFAVSGAGKACVYLADVWSDPKNYTHLFDYNDYYASGGAAIGYYYGNKVDLPAWRAAMGEDAHSLANDPLFVNAASWDFHLQSTAGSWHGGAWTPDAADSPCIDAGNPADLWLAETSSHGSRINLGAFGGSAQASRTPTGRVLTLVSPRSSEALRGEIVIRWAALGSGWGIGDTVRLEYSSDGGANWSPISGGSNVSYAAGVFVWNSGSAAGATFKVRITSNQNAATQASSPVSFILHNAGITYYVNDSSLLNDAYCTAAGNDSNDGLSPSAPKATVKAILDAYDLDAGDVVQVDAGNYTLTSDLALGITDSGGASAPVTIRGVLGRTVFNRSGGGGASFQISGIDYLTIENIEFRGGSYGVSQPSFGYNNIVLRHNVFTGQTSAGVNVYRGGITLEGNTFYQTNAHGYYGGSTNSTLKHNIFAVNGAGKACVYLADVWADPKNYTHLFDYNDYYASGGAAIGYYYGNKVDLPAWRAAMGQDAHSLANDPLFVNAASWDFHLQSTAGSWHGGAWTPDAADSPCIDAGNPADPVLVETAPHGNRINLGAFGGTAHASKCFYDRRLALISPEGGETQKHALEIRWSATGRVWPAQETLLLFYSADGGANWLPMSGGAEVLASLGYFRWDLHGVAWGANYRVRLVAAADAGIFAQSGDFTNNGQYYVNDASTAGDIYCSAAGNDANDGKSPATPKASIQAVLDAYDLEAGDTVFVDAGTFQPITEIFVTSADGGSSQRQVSFLGVKGRTIVDRGASNATGACFHVTGNYVSIENFICRNSSYGISVDSSSDVSGYRIVNNVISGCGTNALYVFRGGWLGKAVIERNLIVHTGSGPALHLRADYDEGYLNLDCGLRNNTIVTTGATGIDISAEGGPIFANNIVRVSGAGKFCVSARDILAIEKSDYNILYATGGAKIGRAYQFEADTLHDWRIVTKWEANSASVDPRFANAALGDYHLRSAYGRYDPSTGRLPGDPLAWVLDSETSLGVDGGDPADPVLEESAPTGQRINAGVYGGTAEASRGSAAARTVRILGPGRGVARGPLQRWETPIDLRIAGTGWQPSDTVRLEYSDDDGAIWRTIVGAASLPFGQRKFWWDTRSLPNRYGYRLRATAVQDGSVRDLSSGYLAIANEGKGDWNLHVAPPGSDDALHGTATQPFRSIAYALELAEGLPGAAVNVRVAGGTYLERVTMEPYVNLLGGYAATDWSRDLLANPVTLDGGRAGSVVTGANNALLEGFTITQGSASGIMCSGTSPTIRSNRLLNNTATFYGGGIYVNGGTPVIASNIITGNSATYGGAIYSNGGSPLIINNTIMNNGSTGIYHVNAGAPVIANCILWNNGNDLHNSAASYSIVEDNDSGVGNLHLNPQLDAFFRATALSPSINAGQNSFVQSGWLDAKGAARVFGRRVDIGADELSQMPPDTNSDFDNDGLPFGWEVLHGLNPNAGADGLLDLDGDGFANRREFMLGTDPGDPSSTFRIRNVTRNQDGSCEIVWDAVPGRNYQVHATTSLTSPFSPLSGVISAGPGETGKSFIDASPAATSKFYRVEIVP